MPSKVAGDTVGPLLALIARGEKLDWKSFPDRLLNRDEAAEVLGGVPPYRLYDLAASRQITAVKLGRTIRFPLSGLLRYIQAGLRPARRGGGNA